MQHTSHADTVAEIAQRSAVLDAVRDGSLLAEMAEERRRIAEIRGATRTVVEEN